MKQGLNLWNKNLEQTFTIRQQIFYEDFVSILSEVDPILQHMSVRHIDALNWFNN